MRSRCAAAAAEGRKSLAMSNERGVLVLLVGVLTISEGRCRAGSLPVVHRCKSRKRARRRRRRRMRVVDVVDGGRGGARA